MNKDIKRYTGVLMVVLSLSVIGYTSAHFGAGMIAGSGDVVVEVGIEESSFLHFSNTGDLNLEASLDNFSSSDGNLSTEVESTVTIKGSTLSTKNYYATLVIHSNNFVYTTQEETPELIMTITGPDGEEIKSLGDLEYVTKNGISGFDVTTVSHDYFVVENPKEIAIPAGSTTFEETYKIKLSFINLETLQNDNSGREFNAEFVLADVEFENTSIMYTIFDNYNTSYAELLASDDPDFSQISGSSKSIHTIEDDYTNSTRTSSVYFRGEVDNNWVYFAGFYWRITRVDGDGNIKLIYSGATAPSAAQSVVMTGTGTRISESYFNPVSTTYNIHMVGYMYSATESHGLTNSSTAKNVIDTWYKNNILSKDESMYVSDSVYCGDRTAYTNLEISNLGTPSTIDAFGVKPTDLYEVNFAPQIRRYNFLPTLKCQYQEDGYTVDDTELGNGALTYPIGLITTDELMLSGGVQSVANETLYLYTGYDYWTMSPNAVSGTGVAISTMSSTGSLAGKVTVGHSPYSIGVRPVLSLSPDIKISGNGDYNNPFKILS